MEKTFRILEINLSDQQAGQIELSAGCVRGFIGGRGLGTRLLWDRTPQGLEPLSGQAEMYILTGPLTGIAPGGAHTCLVFKSPETGNTIGYSLTGAHWGTELRCSGYDGLIIRGQSQKPLYLYIKDGSIEFRDAGRLWGKTTWQTQNLLREETGDPQSSVLCIGPAGERLVRFASVHQEQFRAAARGGPGCVWGSKNLKAIVVRGTRPIPLLKPQTALCVRDELEKTLFNSRNQHPRGMDLSRWGNIISLNAHADKGHLSIKNYREGYWEGINQIDGFSFQRYKSKSRSCAGCPLGCMKVGIIREGAYQDHVVCPDFDSTSTIGPGCMIDDLGAVLYLSRWADEQGLDATSLGNVTGFAMECYERGILSTSDLSGIELRWGNAGAVLALWKKILYRDEIGAILADGVKEAAAKIGKGSEALAMHSKGLEFPGFTPQAAHKKALSYAVADKGPSHHYGSTIDEQNQRVWADSLTVCSWQRRLVPAGLYIKMLRAVMGWDIDISEWDTTAERILMLARAYNIREGVIPIEDDVLPDRAHEEPITAGKKAGSVYPRDKFLADRASWYEARGCDREGIPTIKHLKELQLDFAVPVIQNVFSQE